MLGKQKCRILREIRQKIADENDIPFVTRECGFQGACAGTCPKCESELRYLERQLELRASLGRRVSVAALCAGLMLSAAGCGSVVGGAAEKAPEDDLRGTMAYETAAPLRLSKLTPSPAPEPEIDVETGEAIWPEEIDRGSGEDFLPPEKIDRGAGEDVIPPEDTPMPATWELSGYVAYTPDEDLAG